MDTLKSITSKGLFLILILISINSCTNNTDNKEKVLETTEDNHEQHKDVLSLNSGEKWTIVPEMMTYLIYMNEDINKFEGKTLEEHSSLAIDLSINIDLLTAKCTMKGDAHDQLHIWLVSYIKNVNNFAVAEDVQNAENILQELKNNFIEFNKYFK